MHLSNGTSNAPIFEWLIHQLMPMLVAYFPWECQTYNHSDPGDIFLQHPRNTQWDWVHNGIWAGKYTSGHDSQSLPELKISIWLWKSGWAESSHLAQQLVTPTLQGCLHCKHKPVHQRPCLVRTCWIPFCKPLLGWSDGNTMGWEICLPSQ